MLTEIEKQYILRELQKLQTLYYGRIDAYIETRKDQELVRISFCNYDYSNDTKKIYDKSKLYIHDFKWNMIFDYSLKELEAVKSEMSKIYSMYK